MHVTDAITELQNDELKANGVSLYRLNWRQYDTAPAWDIRLSEHEQQRINELRQQAHKSRFSVCRMAIRWLLAKHLQCDTRDLNLQCSSHGRPTLVPANTDISFNLSHGDGDSLLAISTGAVIGVDLETQRSDVVTLGAAELVFCNQELDYLKAAEGMDRIERFYRLWCLKEAYLKQRGQGFLDDAKQHSMIDIIRGDTRQDVIFFEFEPFPENRAAICISTQD